MNEKIPRFSGAMLLSFVLAFILTILPLRADWILFRPEWIALTLVHWALVAPSKCSFVLAWFFGLMVDAVYGTLMGQYALGFTIVLFLSLRMRSRLLLDSVMQQVFLLCWVLLTYRLINLWILGISGNTPDGWSYWLSVLSSLIVWPLYHYFLRVFHSRKKPFE